MGKSVKNVHTYHEVEIFTGLILYDASQNRKISHSSLLLFVISLLSIDTTGGLLRRGTSTLVAGVNENEVDNVINLINQECSPCVNQIKKRTTIMVFNVDHFEQIS